MNIIDRAPIRRSLIVIGLLSNGVAVVLLSVVLGANEWFSYRDRAVAALSAHAGIVGSNVAPAMLFQDAKAEQEVLDRLAVEPMIAAAVLRDQSGRITAQYIADSGRNQTPLNLPAIGEHLFFADQLLLARAVVHRQEMLGTLYLQSDLGEVQRAFVRKVALILAAMSVSLGIGLFLFLRLQRAISEPLQGLADAMRHAASDNYWVEVPITGGDETRALGTGFNTMLKAIREREGELIEHRSHLEEIVRARTNELHRLNESLEGRVQEEAAKNREKDHLLMRQSRLATLGEMIGNIAHQWRQPLNALGLLLANVRDAQRFGELDQAYVDQSVEKGRGLIEGMSSTIDDFRSLFKPDREKTVFDVAEAVRGALAVVEASFKSANIAVTLETSGNPVCTGFPNEYTHVVLNILGNARDAIRSRGIADGEVHVWVATENRNAVVSIRDNGGGIPVDVIDRIFDPYFTTRENGTGIGLYMSMMMIEQNMGGTIEARNVVNGAQFRVLVPLADEETS